MYLKAKKYKICDTKGNLICYAKGLTDANGNIREFYDMAFSKKGLQDRLESKGYKWSIHINKFYRYKSEGKYVSSILRELCAWWNYCANLVASYNNKKVSWEIVYDYLLTTHTLPSTYHKGALEGFRSVCQREERTLTNEQMESILLGKL